MGRKECAGKRLLLYKIRCKMRRSSTRRHLYSTLSEETGRSQGSLRVAAHRAGLTSRAHSLMCSFSQEEEEALLNVCIVFARRGEPFIIDDFLTIASFFNKGFKTGEFFTRSFARSFYMRHSYILTYKKGKITSPIRKVETMLQKTQEFIAMLNSDMVSHKINKNNLFVFDETIIGNSISLPIVIGERRKSGGGAINVFVLNGKALGCYIPFSMPDGSTPFRVYIFRAGKLKKGQEILEVLIPDEKREFRSTPHRVYLASETGYLTKDLFERVMEEFTIWWRRRQPGLDCYLISDNLRIHTSKKIVDTAESNGIHMYNIMPGSSHWFQVHDQKPFGSLKKKKT